MKIFDVLIKSFGSIKAQWNKRREDFVRHLQASKNIKQRLATKKKEVKIYSLKPYMERAGFHGIEVAKLNKYFFNAGIAVNLILSAYLLYYFSTNFGYDIPRVLFVIVLVWTFLFIFLLFIIWLLFHFVLDLRIFQRKIMIEEVLPDFLELVSANIRAGMPVDRSLWFAVRPRFGVLAKEIEIVAKETMSGEDLEHALEKFAAKYDSLVLKRSINLLVEGIRAGGEIGDLLNKISINIKETQLLKKEMSANVTTYVIFIGFATMLAAPALFGLSYQLLDNMHKITGQMGDMPKQSMMGLNFGGEIGISVADFNIFAYTSLLVTSFFSAILVATIKKGNIKAGVKYIPIFMVTSIVVFKIASFLMSKLFGNLF
jgi:Flp pilus assembly protein TadB